MPFLNSDFITIEDLYIAYRKAKVDAFYERDHVTSVIFVEYEENLTRNIRRVHERITEPSPNWMTDKDFVGTYAYIPKAIKQESKTKFPTRMIVSDPDASWRAMCSAGLKAEAEFRIVGRHPVDFHIVSALWIQKVGHKFDALLGPCAYASRVRRRPPKDDNLSPPSRTSLGSFRPYSFGFRDWRADGLKAMQSALESGKPVIAITADLRRFYHEVDPSYLLSLEFADRFHVHLKPDSKRFTQQFVRALRTWSANTPWVNGREPAASIRRHKVTLPAAIRNLFKLEDASEFLEEVLEYEHPRSVPRAIAFPTRPFTTAEITLLDQGCLFDWTRFRKWVRALRGTEFGDRANSRLSPNPGPPGGVQTLVVPHRWLPAKPLLALSRRNCRGYFHLGGSQELANSGNAR